MLPRYFPSHARQVKCESLQRWGKMFVKRHHFKGKYHCLGPPSHSTFHHSSANRKLISRNLQYLYLAQTTLQSLNQRFEDKALKWHMCTTNHRRDCWRNNLRQTVWLKRHTKGLLLFQEWSPGVSTMAGDIVMARWLTHPFIHSNLHLTCAANG